MNKIFWALLILVLLVFAGAVIFVATLDVDRYRPAIVSQMESALGKPVTLEKITLTWKDGLALGLKGLKVLEGPGKDELLRVQSAHAVAHLMPLLQRNVEISTIVLEKPWVRVVRGSDGKIRGFEPVKTSSKDQKAAAAVSLIVREIHVEHAEIFFRDEMQAPPVEMLLRNADIEIRKPSLFAPIHVEGRMALWSKEQNFRVATDVVVPPQEKNPSLKDLQAEMDLETIDMAELTRFVPGAKALGSRPQGHVTANIETLPLDAQAIQNAQAEVHLTNGALDPPGFASVIEDIFLEAKASQGSLRLESVSAALAGGKISASGNVNFAAAQPVTGFQSKFENLDLKKLLGEGNPGEPALEGIFGASFQGTFQGFEAPLATQSLNAQGEAVLKNGVVRNLNILNEVFGRLSIIPGLMDRLNKHLPPSYHEKFEARDTFFEDARIPVAVVQGTAQFNSLELATDSFHLSGSGTISPGGQLAASEMVILDPELSDALIHSVKELQYLADREGRVGIPLTLRGTLPKVSVVPDLQYVASKLATAKTAEVLNDLFKKKNPQQEPAQTSAEAPAAQDDSQSDLFGQLLKAALKTKSSQPSQN